jgi:hypothetical protein
MPDASDEDAPDVYALWRDWAAFTAAGETTRRQTGDQLTADNWDDFWPAARKAALIGLRRRDPSAARALLEAKLGSENAEARLRLVSLLSERLSGDDVAFLESLAANDRAEGQGACNIDARTSRPWSRRGRGYRGACRLLRGEDEGAAASLPRD